MYETKAQGIATITSSNECCFIRTVEAIIKAEITINTIGMVGFFIYLQCNAANIGAYVPITLTLGQTFVLVSILYKKPTAAVNMLSLSKVWGRSSCPVLKNANRIITE